MASTAQSEDAGYIIDLGDGLGIRRMRESDSKASSMHMNNINVWNMLRNRIPFPYTEADAASWIALNQQPDQHVRTGPWHSQEIGATGPAVPAHYTITLDDEAIGAIGLTFGSDVYFRSAELGYWLGEAHWGQGVMSRVVSAFVRWAWAEFGLLVRLNAETNERNAASRRLLEKAGFVLEGRRPDLICKRGQLSAALIWGALRPV